MATPDPNRAATARQVDAVGVGAALRRIARAPQPPWLHAEVARRMGERLGLVRLRPEVLVDWSGWAGASAAVLDAAYPSARRLVVEPLAALRERSRAEARRPWWTAWRGGARRVEVLDGEPPAASAQLVWSNMVLHATVDPPALLGAWQRALAESAASRCTPASGRTPLRELRALYRAHGWGPPGIDFVDMHDLGDMMVHAGFADPVMDQEPLTLTWESPQAALAELRSIGGNVSPGARGGAAHAALARAPARRAGGRRAAGGRLSMTFEIVYGHAFKAAPRPPRGDTRVRSTRCGRWCARRAPGATAERTADGFPRLQAGPPPRACRRRAPLR